MRAPDLNKSKDDVETTNIFNGPSETQLTGCVFCVMSGNLENPAVIYHYMGTTYCMDHILGAVQQGAAQQ